MNELEELVMVVKREALFVDGWFSGFRPQSEIDYESRILANFCYMRRASAEEDPTHKQPIAYSVIVNPVTKQVFAYRRSSRDVEYSETRLQGQWSWGIGGHIEQLDARDANPILVSMLRELREEVELSDLGSPRVLGYINSDSDDVGKVHFGILYVVETSSRVVCPKDPEIHHGELRSVELLESMCSSPDLVVETWSKICLGPVKSYLQEL